ncbi:YhgE/Pip family protein [Microbacterium luticocti]|uniref:YhgE/Pip family protein n=1 Tax=Microbacterium luticocti TaxID=451764 RepID=UPI00042860B2|nr:YhgE/Pip family protein [Microbacterium luticocti]
MRLHIERARARRPVTWLTLLGVLLLPVLIGGVLVAALYNPTERLDAMHAAVVNEDSPVTVDGQLVPLGRQLTAGLVTGSDAVPSNLDWTISNAAEAKAGLKDGTYQAVVTIPENFSAAAVSPGKELAGDGDDARQATIRVETAPDARVIDDAITAQVTQAAASTIGSTLSSSTLQNVFLSFTTLGDQLGTAADGAAQWADGARTSAEGAHSLADGVHQLANGAGSLADGADGIAGGASQLASGAKTWAAGARSAAEGLGTWAGGARTLAGSTRELSAHLSTIADGLAQAPQIPQELIDAAHQLADNSAQISQSVTGAVDRLDELAAQCAAQGGSAQLCAGLTEVAASAREALPHVTGVIDNADQIAQGVDGLSKLPQVAEGLAQISGGMTQVAGGMDGLATGATDAAAGVRSLATGAGSLADGAAQAADGASQWADGARTWAAGAAQSAEGATALGDGIGALADGADEISSGLHKAADALPSFSDEQAKSLASVVADPVAAEGLGENMFGTSAIPLLAMLALWFGGLGSFVAFQAVSRRALTSRRPSALLALRALAPAAALGAAQGLLVAGIVQVAASYDWGTWSVFATVCVVAGIAFAAVNQALVAVLGGAGRWVAALVGVLAVATGVVSTVPGLLVAISSWLPTAPALTAGLASLTTSGGLGAGLAGLAVWSLLGFGATVVAVMRRRTTGVKALLSEVPVAA